MSRRLHGESGMSLVEMVIVCAVSLIVLAGVSTMFVSGSRATSDADARLASQQNIRLALDRLEYETRCASSARLLSGGAGVALTLPATCPHASGSIAWCVSGGALVRFVGTGCTGAGQSFVSSVTSPTPFSCLAPDQTLPQLQVSLSVNTTGRPADANAATDTITLRNAAATTDESRSCS